MPLLRLGACARRPSNPKPHEVSIPSPSCASVLVLQCPRASTEPRASTVRWRAQRATGKDACNTLTEKIPRETVGNPNWREDEWYLEKYCPLELHSLRHNVTYSEGDEIERRRQDAHKRKKREHDELIKTRAAKAEEARANSKKTTRNWRARSRAR